MALGGSKLCGWPKCGKLTRNAYCDVHVGREAQSRRPKRESSSARGYNARWRAARIAYLHEHPLCAACKRDGRIHSASQVDHILPHKGDPDLFWDVTNWQALCASCHSRKTALEDGRWSTGEALPALQRPLHSALHVVCGPDVYASTCYARSCVSSIVIDEYAPYVRNAEARKQARIERNANLRSMCEGVYDVGYLVTDAPKAYERAHWRGIAVSVTVLLPHSLDVCERMIESDDALGKHERIRIARDWYSRYAADPFSDVCKDAYNWRVSELHCAV